MKPRTEELLYFLLWSTEQLLIPTFRNLNESFEGWAYRNGFMRQLQELERRKFLERNASKPLERIYRLSESGRLRALGGRDPEACWRRPWDGHWRLVIFDIPEVQSTIRRKLRRYLRGQHFGYLQDSVWISPDPLTTVTKELGGRGEDVESLITFDSGPGSRESNKSIVAGSWDFQRINQLYEHCLTILSLLPEGSSRDPISADKLLLWARRERTAWRKAISADPLLPRELLPPEYIGEKVWKKRRATLARASRHIR